MTGSKIVFSTAEKSVLIAPLRLSQARWTSTDVANLLGCSQSFVARTWRKFFTQELGFQLPGEIELLTVNYSQRHGLLLARVHDDSQTLEPPSTDMTRAMRSPRRIAIQTLLAGLLANDFDSDAGLSLSEQCVTQAPFGISNFALGTSERPSALPVHIAYRQIPHELWQALLLPLIQQAHLTPAAYLQRLQQELVTWFKKPETEFLWIAERLPQSGQMPPRSRISKLRSSQQVVADQVFEQIVDLVWAGKLTAGDRITESSLASALHTTRNQTRDALRALASSGLVDHHPVRGVLVPAPKRSDIADIYAARRALGTEILRRAIENASLDLTSVNNALQDVIATGKTGNSYETGNADLHFQDVIAQASGMRNIPQMFNILAKQLRIYIAVMGFSYFYSIEDMIHDDSEIYRHLENRNFEGARVAWNKKINDSLTFMTTHLSKSRQ